MIAIHTRTHRKQMTVSVYQVYAASIDNFSALDATQLKRKKATRKHRLHSMK